MLGVLPGGTGNDFLRDFEVFGLEGAAEAIASGRTTAVDVADVIWPGGHPFVVNVWHGNLGQGGGAPQP